MDHGIDAAELLRNRFANVDRHRGNVRIVGTEHAVGVQAVIQAHHVVSRRLKHWGEHRADIALVSGYQNFHETKSLGG